MAIDEAGSLIGAQNARMIVIALFSLSVYEWAITLDEEIKYFWTGSWEISRILFLINRYLNPTINILALLCFSLPNPSIDLWVPFITASPESNRNGSSCQRAIQLLFVGCILALSVVQAMLVVRIWYLFGHSRTMRLMMAISYIVSNVVSIYFAILAGLEIHVLPSLTQFGITGCHATRPPRFWRLYLPSLVLHTVLYCMTAYRASRNRRLLKEAPMLKRLVRDGGFFYFVVFISVLFTSIGSFLDNHPKINIPAIFSNFPVAMTSIAASRVMLSIHSLASKISSDSAWLLNNMELSRVPWRRGATEGEIIVDRFESHSQDAETEDGHPYSLTSDSIVSLKTSTVGRWTDETW